MSLLVMNRLLGGASGDSGAATGGGDSFVDRLNSRYTVMLLGLFSLGITTKHYVGDPMNCWCPAHFTKSHVDFTNSVCWTTGTYYLDVHQLYIPKHEEPKQMIGYYQWVPLILILMAILFYAPRVLWMLLNNSAGVQLSTVIGTAVEYQSKSDMEQKKQHMEYMTNRLGRVLTESMHSTGRHRFRIVRKAFFVAYGNRLIAAYVFIKCIYLANVIAQFLILDIFLGIDFHGYGLHIIQRLIRGENWQTSSRFPRVTLCDIWVRVLGNNQRYTIQCSLPMNLVNEFVFIFIWFWFIFVFLATLGSLLKWTFISLNTGRQVDYTMARLNIINTIDQKQPDVRLDRGDVTNFVRNFLERDGFLMIRLVAHNTNDILASELLCRLWKYYLEHKDTIETLYTEGKQGASRRGKKMAEQLPLKIDSQA